VENDGGAARNDRCSPDELDSIKSCKTFLEQKDKRVKWFEFCPRYGCVILCFTTSQQLPGMINIEILGLGETVFAMHGNFGGEKDKYE